MKNLPNVFKFPFFIGVFLIYAARSQNFGDVRLADGNRYSTGRVELYNSTWGTVCEHFWSLNDANVVCKQLGFDKAVITHKAAFFGKGKGPIWLDNLLCTGDEANLFACNNSKVNCNHTEDVGVECEAIPRLRAVSKKSTSFVLKWLEAPNATSYQIIWQEFESNISGGLDNVISSPDLRYPIMDLMTSTKYIVTVCALRDNATLGCSTIDVKTLPAAPSSVEVISTTSRMVKISWQLIPDDSITKYEIGIKPSDSGTYIIKTVSRDENSTEFAVLQQNTNYTVRVRAITSKGIGDANITTVITKPATIQVNAFSINSTSVEVSWLEVHGATRYKLTWRSDGNVLGNEDITGSHYTITGLNSSTNYNTTVCAFKNEKLLGYNGVSVKTKPAAPSDVEATPNMTSMVITWKGVLDDDIIDYEVIFEPTDGGSSMTVIIGGNKNSTEIEGLQPNTNYTVTIRAVTSDGEGDPTSITVTTEPAFISVTVVSISSTTLTLRWSEVDGATEYGIVWRFVGDVDENEVVSSSPYTITGLSSSTEYYIKVCAFKDGDRLGCSDVSVTTVPVAPSVTEVTPKETSVIVTWIGVPDDDIVNYTVTIVPTDGGSPTTMIVGGDKNSTEIEGLQPNTNYTVTIRAVTSDGEGDPTSITVTTEPAFISVTVVSISSTTLTLRWSEVDGATEYGIVWRFVGDVDENEVVSSSPYTITGLSSSTEYYIKVCAFKDGDRLGCSDVSVITVPVAPSVTEVTPKETSVIVTWIRVPDDDIVNYTVTIVPTDGGSPTTMIVGGDKNSTEIEGLQPNTNYTVTVRAVTPDGEGDPTSMTVTTKAASIVISVVSINSTSMKVSWSEVDGATRYEIVWKSGGDVVGKVNVTTSPYTITGLNSSTNYNTTVCAFKNEKLLGYNGVSVKTKPAAPSDVEATPNMTSMVITWKGVLDDDIIDYEVIFEPTDGGSSMTVIIGGNKSSTEIEGLQPNTNYTVTIRAVTSDGEGDPTSITVTTEPAFISVTVVSISSTTLTLRWSEVDGATEYGIVWRFVGDVDENEVVSSSPYTITGLSSSTEYYIKVCAFKDGDRLGCSDVSVITVPVAPSVTEVTPKETSVIVTWIGVPDDDIVNYTVTIVPTDGGSPTTMIVGGDKNSTEIEGLQPNTNYTVTIRAVTSDGEGDPTSMTVTTKAASIVISVVSINSTSMKVSWSEVDGATRYEIVWKSGGDVVGEVNVTTSPYTITGLDSSTKYINTVLAFRNEKRLGYKGFGIRTVPAAPSDIEVTPNTTSMIVAWIGIPDDQILNYKVTIVPTDGGSPINITVGGDKNSTEIEGLQPNTNYTLTVRAVTPDGEGDPTSIAVITKTDSIIVTVKDIDSSTIQVSWTEVNGTTSYTISWTKFGDNNVVLGEISTNATCARITGLQSSTEYNITVCAVKNNETIACEKSPSEYLLDGTKQYLKADAHGDSWMVIASIVMIICLVIAIIIVCIVIGCYIFRKRQKKVMLHEIESESENTESKKSENVANQDSVL